VPVPTPQQGESENDFMRRCVGAMVGEGRDQDQAVAICSTQWEESKGTRKSYSLAERVADDDDSYMTFEDEEGNPILLPDELDDEPRDTGA